ncbi:MAG: phosphoribosylformylglycinamidine synthase subunit PurL, partial [Bacteroidota bacterium]
MKAWELLLSESQERMLMVVEKGKEAQVLAVFEKWDLSCSNIGEVTDDGLLNFYMHGELEASLPAYELVLGGGAPQYTREYKAPAYLAKVNAFDMSSVADTNNLQESVKQLVQIPSLYTIR